MSLPFIPSYLQDSSKGRTKSTLIYKNGYAVPRQPTNSSTLLASGGGEPTLSWDPELTYTVVKRAASPIEKAKTTQVEHESLAFEAYYHEKVQYSASETSRVRRVTICYFLRDQSIMINEKRDPNSGLPQGIVLKRQRVSRSGMAAVGNEDVLRPRDFAVGSDVVLFARSYHVYDADFFTRTYFYDNEHLELDDPEPVPDDSNTLRKKQLLETKSLPPVSGGTPDKLQLKKFLENDKRVLRFFSYWDDRANAAAFGQLRKFQLHFFLADDSLQIVEDIKPNSGVLPAPVFMRRTKPPASFGDVNQIRIGSAVEVHARTFIVYDLDEFTKDYFRKNHGVTDFTPVKLDEPQEAAPVVAPITDPALFLIPKPAKKNFQKLLGNDRKVLRFAASIENGRGTDDKRSFIISYYLADDTLSIYEPPQRNSGVVGGKFLERRQVQKPKSKELYRESDLFVGAIIEVFNHRFKLRNADDYAFNYMEANTDAFPASDIDNIQKKLRALIASNSQLSVDVIQEAFRQFDTDSSGTISLAEFKQVIEACGFNLSDQEVITLMRRYDLDGDGTISYEEFSLVLSQ
eukprot:TRINITY_DN241_c0_g1_i11.p1 TRINITY_DN241_c0_g1~~TRINITY_DN241_c0_g1_i11.p1  ORF type:complete len:574 (-),score=256.51 TRINITY_DN241_c0_g1_i11:254-1975(-)